MVIIAPRLFTTVVIETKIEREKKDESQHQNTGLWLSEFCWPFSSETSDETWTTG